MIQTPVSLFACTALNTVARVVESTGTTTLTHSAFGDRPHTAKLDNRHGFVGQLLERDNTYLLGNGYRTYNPRLLRFHGPDSLSPFDEGGLNAYGYCGGDPLNRHDPSGHVWLPRWIRRRRLSSEQVQIPMAVNVSTLPPGKLGIDTLNPQPNSISKKTERVLIATDAGQTPVSSGYVASRFGEPRKSSAWTLRYRPDGNINPNTSKPAVPIEKKVRFELPKVVRRYDETFLYLDQPLWSFKARRRSLTEQTTQLRNSALEKLRRNSIA